jgi:pyridoxamine 5'-phosphate oxidase
MQMFEINSLNNSAPYKKFKHYLSKALKNNQHNMDAILIASYDKFNNEVDARYVNLKYINNDKWIFFTNYNSPKAQQFINHDQISAVIYWPIVNIQIRMKAVIKKTTKDISENHFKKRAREKNAIAISSNQSSKIESYELVEKNYKDVLNSQNLELCPDFWGGYEFTPHHIEFWEGSANRLNKRELFIFNDDCWNKYILQP